MARLAVDGLFWWRRILAFRQRGPVNRLVVLLQKRGLVLAQSLTCAVVLKLSVTELVSGRVGAFTSPFRLSLLHSGNFYSFFICLDDFLGVLEALQNLVDRLAVDLGDEVARDLVVLEQGARDAFQLLALRILLQKVGLPLPLLLRQLALRDNALLLPDGVVEELVLLQLCLQDFENALLRVRLLLLLLLLVLVQVQGDRVVRVHKFLVRAYAALLRFQGAVAGGLLRPQKQAILNGLLQIHDLLLNLRVLLAHPIAVVHVSLRLEQDRAVSRQKLGIELSGQRGLRLLKNLRFICVPGLQLWTLAPRRLPLIGL